MAVGNMRKHGALGDWHVDSFREQLAAGEENRGYRVLSSFQTSAFGRRQSTSLAVDPTNALQPGFENLKLC